MIELVVAPCADAAAWIGRYVGRHQLAERRGDRTAAREVLAALRRVAGGAIADDGKVVAALDQRVVLPILMLRPCCAHSAHGQRGQQQRTPDAHACTSGPGCLRYCLRIASAA